MSLRPGRQYMGTVSSRLDGTGTFSLQRLAYGLRMISGIGMADPRQLLTSREFNPQRPTIHCSERLKGCHADISSEALGKKSDAIPA